MGKGRNGIQVIERAARILRALKDNQSGMSLGQIAEAVDLPRSTVQRIVGALQSERLVIAGSNGGRLRLGPELSALAEAARYNIVETCRLLLTELAQATGETADLSVLRGSAMIFLDQVPGTHRLRTVSSVGEAFPLTSTANGRACLALMENDAAMALAREEWSRQGHPGDEASLLNELERIRRTGLAYDLDEHTQGICAVGFAFADWTGDLHSISVPVPTTRFEEIRDVVEDALRNTAGHVQRMMEKGRFPT
ncbi:HTH-type transcriptional regulator SrpS [Pseudoprimorskyibacter insulae]|uniref:HTH-type transcriptional regulator SrpS n=1 Tax=Pseudoprimorskyibacter insulae TaxID=1695997 RepID=A0A2R8AR42_9RHOB|nr:HTH-type transcriptional regulator SrpS [Pseudoprimorskyibacter insulae]